MSKMTLRKQGCLIFCLILLLLVLTIAWPVSALPPRPTPVPPPATAVSPTGGFIVLAAAAETAVSPAWWTRVQWQDPDGAWHEVDGWRGAFDHELHVTWWVAPKDLSSGPFRWLVYASEESEMVLAVSDPFYLPAAHQTTTVHLSVP